MSNTSCVLQRLRGSAARCFTPIGAPLCLSLAVGCASEDPDGVGAIQTAECGQGVTFAEAPCAVDLPEGRTPDSVRCGYLTVPENREQPNAKTIELAVIVYRATGANPKPDPVLFLSGGPGGNALTSMSAWAPSRWSAANTDRDFVLFDQRGTGMSRPALHCPEYDEAFRTFSATTADPEEFNAGLREAMGRCYQRLAGEGHDLASYTSAASARDACDLMATLGYGEYNAYGVSYGTRLAQTIMRDVPAGLRSAILDGVVPVPSGIERSRRSFEVAMGTLFANCAADAACAAAYPDLETTFYNLVASLNATPHTVTWTDSATAEPRTVVVTGNRLLFGFEGAIRNPALIPVLPQFIAATAAGDMTLLEAQVPSSVAPSGSAQGIFYSVRCRDDLFGKGVTFDDDALREEYRQALPLSDANCDVWPVPPPDARELEPVTSSVPTLLLSGVYDPITPAINAEAVAARISPSQHFVIPNLGHGTMRASSPDGVAGECTRELGHIFLDAPTSPVDGSCVDTIPPVAWAVPQQAP